MILLSGTKRADSAANGSVGGIGKEKTCREGKLMKKFIRALFKIAFFIIVFPIAILYELLKMNDGRR